MESIPKFERKRRPKRSVVDWPQKSKLWPQERNNHRPGCPAQKDTWRGGKVWELLSSSSKISSLDFQGFLKNGSTKDGHCCTVLQHCFFLYKEQWIENTDNRLTYSSHSVLQNMNFAGDAQHRKATAGNNNIPLSAYSYSYSCLPADARAGTPGCALCATSLLIKLLSLLKQAGHHMFSEHTSVLPSKPGLGSQRLMQGLAPWKHHYRNTSCPQIRLLQMAFWRSFFRTLSIWKTEKKDRRWNKACSQFNAS